MALGIVDRAVDSMREHGAQRIVAWLGPRVCGRCYEVPAAMRDEVSAVVPAAWAETSWGTPALDIGAGVARPARCASASRSSTSAAAPARTPTLHSYRRDGDDVRPSRRAGVALVSARSDELAANLDAVRGRIAAACADAGRAADDVRLVVVTKFFPASDVRLLAGLGVTDVGENRHQEAEAKAAECADLDLTWHFIGGLQSNKAAAVAAYADVVESVDRAKLLKPLAAGARARDHEVDVLLQVSLDPPDATGRSGADPDQLSALAAAVAEAESLRLRGLMAVAPLGEDPASGVRPAGRDPPGAARRPPRRDLALGGHERRPRARRTRRRDTRAHRLRGPRFEASVQVGSKTPPVRPFRGRRTPEDTVMSGAMRRIGEYLGLLEDTGRYDEEYGDYAGDYETQETAAVAAVRPTKRESRPAPVSDLSERRRPAPGPTGVVAELSRITTLHPRTYNEARTVGENFREGTPVIMNLSEMDDNDAKRLVDFAAGLVFATRGTIERVTAKVFLLSPPNVDGGSRGQAASCRGGRVLQPELRILTCTPSGRSSRSSSGSSSPCSGSASSSTGCRSSPGSGCRTAPCW